MALEKSIALILRVIEFSETSCVVTLFTREFGKVGALAKGGRRPKGPFESALDLLSLVRVVLLRKSSDALDLLTEARLEKRFRPADRNLSRIYAGYYVAELLNELTDTCDPHPELFDAAVETLAHLSSAPAVPLQILRFELTALRLTGHFPSLHQCVECAAPVEGAGRIALGLVDGGVLCAHCRPGKRHVLSLSARAWQCLVELSLPPDSNAPLANDLPLGELRGAMNQYLSHQLGRELRLHNYLAISQ